MVSHVERLTPSDVPLDPEMQTAEIEWLASHEFCQRLDPAFRTSKAFREILRTHTRIVRCKHGGIIVREGDWGNSAFLVLSGEVVVEVEPPGAFVPPAELGRRESKKLNFGQRLALIWRKRRDAEFRDYQNERHVANTRNAQQQACFQDVPRLMRDYRTVTLSKGELFGELAALGRSARNATVFAIDTPVLLEIRWQGLRDLMKNDLGLRQQIDTKFRENALRSFLNITAFSGKLGTDESVLDELVREARLETYGDYDRVGSFTDLAAEGKYDLSREPLIAKEGDYPNGVVLIRNGVARLSRQHHNGHQTISYLTPGKAFGLDEITQGWQSGESVPLKYSLRAIGFLSAVIIPTLLVEKHILESSSLVRTKLPKPPKQTSVKSGGAKIKTDTLEFLVEGGFVNGAATMLINLDRCTRCDDCVRACAEVHDDNPRFLRQGPIHDNLMVAQACMHCQDPVCMIQCPTGAISRQIEKGEVTINDLSCVGCGACSNNCPYDAIRMVEVRDQHGKFIRATKDKKPIRKATKCDLCVDQLGGPACQKACPHDALVRIDMGNEDAVAAWLQR